MTRDEFIDGYTSRSKLTRNADGFTLPGCPPRIAVICHCGDPECEGFAMVGVDSSLQFYVRSGDYEIPKDITTETKRRIARLCAN